ncbi:hypothetical protein Bdiaspc4_11760 [Bradyrhizobium diazoefficiens]|nr:hypothetical protein AAV28_08365 [Bradyrhizobium diazoefficiens USDA 110]QBP21127.1 hypothetical protein Bdiaspc4_11760 [Bradyrhizobium diazoefficiens]
MDMMANCLRRRMSDRAELAVIVMDVGNASTLQTIQILAHLLRGVHRFRGFVTSQFASMRKMDQRVLQFLRKEDRIGWLFLNSCPD